MKCLSRNIDLLLYSQEYYEDQGSGWRKQTNQMKFQLSLTDINFKGVKNVETFQNIVIASLY